MTEEYIEKHFEKLLLNKNRLETDEVYIRNVLKTHLNQIPDKKLYKYRTCSKINFRTLKSKQIYMSPASNFKDAFDYTLNLNIEANIENLQNWMMLNIDKILYHSLIRECKKMKITTSLTEKDVKEIHNKYFADNGDFLEELYDNDYKDTELNSKKLSNLVKDGLKTYLQTTNGELNKLCEKFMDIMKNTNNNLRQCSLIYCLSSNNNNCSMWENYSDNYSGFCIEYDFSDIDNMPIKVIKNLISLMPINYIKQRPEFSIVPFAESVMNKMIGEEVDDSKIHIEVYKHLLMKKSDYSFEQEWRLAIENKHNNLQYFPFVSGIYMGKNISESNKNELKRIADKLEVPIYKQRINFSGNDYEYIKI